MMLRRIFRGKIRSMHFIHAFILAFFLAACGDDNGSSPAPDDLSSSSKTAKSSSSSKPVIQSGDSHEDSSNSKNAKSSTSSKNVKSSSSSKPVILSSSEGSSNGKSSSSVPGTKSSGSAKSSSSKNGDPGTRSSSSGQAPAGMTSSSVTPKSSSSEGKKIASTSSSSWQALSSTPRNDVSSSSEYVPFDHSQTLAGAYKVGENAYKQFTDTRNGRSYYYITITSDYSGKSVTVMAENLNIGKMVPGAENQNDDNEIERYCYNNDTTKCDEFGGLYQWAEMMQLPSRCNTESCADLIQENHKGICPDGWRLFTYDDYEIVRGYKDENGDGIKGLRSTYGFSGTNASGFSLTGAGIRSDNGTFNGLKEKIFIFRPIEYEADAAKQAHHMRISAALDSGPSENARELKTKGFSVRCVKVED